MKRTYVLLLLAFAASILVRLPNLNRPLSKHHEFCTAVAAIVVDNWVDHGMQGARSLPNLNYPGKQNAHIQNAGLGHVQIDGTYPYLSHPMLGYLAPAAIKRLLPHADTVLLLQLFNMLLHGLCAWLLLLIAVRLNLPPPAPLLAAVLYLFLPNTLWFQSNVYMSDMAVQLPFLWAVLAWLNFQYQPGRVRLAWLCLAVFVACLTEWLGYAVALAVALAIMSQPLPWKTKAGQVMAVGLAAALALSGTLLHYASFVGLEGLADYFSHRYATRGGVGFASHGLAAWLGEWWQLLRNHVLHHGLSLALVFVVWLLRRPLRLPRRAWLLLAVPVVLHHVIFLSYSHQDFSVLKAAPMIAILGALALQSLRPPIRMPALCAMLLIHIGLYFAFNTPGTHSWRGDRYDTAMLIGEQIRTHTAPSEVAFYLGEVNPQMVWYAKRNIKAVASPEEVRDFLRRTGQLQGRIFSDSSEPRPMSVEE